VQHQLRCQQRRLQLRYQPRRQFQRLHQGKSETINLVTQNMAFDTKLITVPVGVEVTVNFENKDKIGHNLAVYMDKSAAKSIFIGEIISSKAVVYNFRAPEHPCSPGTVYHGVSAIKTWTSGYIHF
jgi:plastocyanin